METKRGRDSKNIKRLYGLRVLTKGSTQGYTRGMLDEPDEEWITNYLKETKLMDDTEQTAWTSIDVYYQGFHTKKSFPKDLSWSQVKLEIEEAKAVGFKPSWNEDTNKTSLPTVASSQTIVPLADLTASCTVHNVKMGQAVSKKTNMPYWFHKDNEGSMCFGKGYQPKK